MSVVYHKRRLKAWRRVFACPVRATLRDGFHPTGPELWYNTHMNLKALPILSVCVAVVVGGGSAAYVSAKRAQQAQALAEAESARADAAAAEAKKADREAAAEAERARAAEERRKEAQAQAEKARLDNETASLNATAAAENRKAKEADEARARSDADAERARRDTARAQADAAKAGKEREAKIAEAEASKAQAEADKRAADALKADKANAEAKLRELYKLDLESFARDLAERERDVTEREQALRPEKTIADLSWAGGEEDSVIDEKGNVAKKAKTVYLAENDRTLPLETRLLSRAERLAGESSAESEAKARKSVVATLESLYVAALREDRVVDADFYRKSLVSMYPDWELKLTATNAPSANP